MQRREFLIRSSMLVGAAGAGRFMPGLAAKPAASTLTGPNYAPRGMIQWDTWYVPVGDKVHVSISRWPDRGQRSRSSKQAAWNQTRTV